MTSRWTPKFNPQRPRRSGPSPAGSWIVVSRPRSPIACAAPNHSKKLEVLGELYTLLFGNEFPFDYPRWAKIWKQSGSSYAVVMNAMLKLATWDPNNGDPTNVIAADLRKSNPPVRQVRKFQDQRDDDEAPVDPKAF